MITNTIPPCLDNIETLGMSAEASGNTEPEFMQRTKWNRNRGNKISTKARQNDAFYRQIQSHIMQMDAKSPAFAPFIKARRDLQNCCRHTLVRRWKEPYSVDFISAHTCKNKICNVCNYVRSKALRRKYIKYLTNTDTDCVDMGTGAIYKLQELDFFHLTLTVPHTELKGWRGQKIFVKELMREFNFMRKKTFWKENVYAGEFGVEFTRKGNGIHCHIHALIVAYPSKGNRNFLYKEILKAWNRQTVCPYSNRDKFTEVEIEAIRKGCKSLTDEEVKELHPKGSTFVSLESLYTIDKQTGKKRYIRSTQDENFIAGIMECIKYHFEPLCFNKEDKTIDFQLLEELLPEIAGKPLYRKFGAFHGLKALNINESQDLAEEVIENLEDTARDKATHPETGMPAEDYEYIIINARMLHYDKDNKLKPKIRKSAKKIFMPDCRTITQALQRMCMMGWQNSLKAKTREQAAALEFSEIEDTFYFDEPELLIA